MNQKGLKEKLRKRRDRHDFDQHYMGAKLNISQPYYSLIENGKVKISDKLLQKIKGIKGFDDFDKEELEEVLTLDARQIIFKRWPFGRRSLFFALVAVGLLYFEKVLEIAEYMSRGFNGGAGTHIDLTTAVVLVLGSPFVIFVCWLFWPKKWRRD